MFVVFFISDRKETGKTLEKLKVSVVVESKKENFYILSSLHGIRVLR